MSLISSHEVELKKHLRAQKFPNVESDSSKMVNSKNPTIFNILHWVEGTNDSSTKCLMFQVLFFFHNNL